MRYVLSAIGASTAYGPRWDDARPMLSSQKMPFRRQRGFMGSDFKPQLTAFPTLQADGRLIDRLATLSTQAMDDLLSAPAPAVTTQPGHRISVVLCGPDAPAFVTPDDLTRLAHHLAARAGDGFGAVVDSIAAFSDGPVGGVTGLAQTLPQLNVGRSLLLVTVDSFNHLPRLRMLGDANQLVSNRSPYGLIPGEAAAALLITSSDGTEPGDVFCISGIGQARADIAEGERGDSDYRALTQASQSAVPSGQTVDRLMTNWNNNRYRAAEMSYVHLRSQHILVPECDVIHPPLRFGDIGAACAGLSLVLAREERGTSLIALSGGPHQHQRGAISAMWSGPQQ